MSVALHCRIWLTAIPLAALVPAQDELSIRVEVDLVSVLCSVRNQRGALVTNLKQDDFILMEEGRPQTIRNFARETDLPLTVGLLVDTSNSQVRLIESERRAAASRRDCWKLVRHAADCDRRYGSADLGHAGRLTAGRAFALASRNI